MYKIQTVTAGSAVASLDFTVPSGYDDLLIVYSGRLTAAPGQVYGASFLRFNGTTTNYSMRRLYGNGSGASSDSDSSIVLNTSNSSSTASTFGSGQIYISNYASTNAKSVSIETVSENNGTSSFQEVEAGLWNNSATITSISIEAIGTTHVQGSTATLYGIRKYNTTATPKATGGIITYANGYWVHTFTASGTFTPTQNLTCEYLVIAGGGSGGTEVGGGGGAGGYRSSVSGESSGRGASAESPLSLTASTNYTVTVGAGGASAANGSRGNNGSNSVFSTITSTGGGGGGRYGEPNGLSGGAGGGGGYFTSAGTGGAGTTGQGYDGGNGSTGFSPVTGGGGGGAGSAGATGAANGGNGGSGVSSSITGTAIVRAGGGGGAMNGTGSAGGGNAGTADPSAGQSAQAFTGSGGGAGRNAASGAGGSGVVIIRYAA